MRSARLSAAVMLVLLGGCMLPRPVDSSEYIKQCEVAGPPPPGSLLFLTTRLPDCRDAKANRMTWWRAPGPMHGVWAANGPQFVSADAWAKELKRQLGTGKKTPILYIHGFNNDNAAALARAAAIRLAVGNDRAVIALTWPSYNSKRKYFWDEANAEWTMHEARNLLDALSALDTEVIVVAHSMGNRVALDLVRSWSARQPTRPLPIKALIMASPDVDRAWFTGELGRGFAIPITLYGSTRDQALSASWRAHGHPRAGDLSRWVTGNEHAYPYAGIGGISIVDTSDIARGLVAHADFIESRQGAADLCRIINGLPTDPGREGIPGQDNMERLAKKPKKGDDCTPLGQKAADYLG